MDLNILTSDPYWRSNRHPLNVDYRGEDTDIEDWATPDDSQLGQKWDDGNVFTPLPIFTSHYRDEITPSIASNSFDTLDNSPPIHHSYFQSVLHPINCLIWNQLNSNFHQTIIRCSESSPTILSLNRCHHWRTQTIDAVTKLLPLFNCLLLQVFSTFHTYFQVPFPHRFK